MLSGGRGAGADAMEDDDDVGGAMWAQLAELKRFMEAQGLQYNEVARRTRKRKTAALEDEDEDDDNLESEEGSDSEAGGSDGAEDNEDSEPSDELGPGPRAGGSDSEDDDAPSDPGSDSAPYRRRSSASGRAAGRGRSSSRQWEGQEDEDDPIAGIDPHLGSEDHEPPAASDDEAEGGKGQRLGHFWLSC